MVSHMSAVQIALLFNSYLVHFYSQRNCSFDIMSIQPGKHRFISTGATTWETGKRSGLASSDPNAPEVRSMGLDPSLG